MTAELNDEPKCPYCGSTDPCEHVLLIVDLTFRSAESGALMDAFNKRWSDTWDTASEDDDFDKKESFDDLINEVDGVADYDQCYEFEGGPGCSSTYQLFYVSSEYRIKAALARFESH